jgi:membrane protease YdiL (CAAX protease family)
LQPWFKFSLEISSQVSTAAQKLPLLTSLYLIAPLVLWGFCWLEGTTFASYGMPLRLTLASSVGWGLGAGSLGLALLFGVQYRANWLEHSTLLDSSQRADRWQVLVMLVLGLWVGWTEELIFRGFLQDQLQQNWPVWVAASIASLIFALLHGVWEGKSVLPQLPGLWLMGMVLVLARLVDAGNLGLAWGLHAGWVWVIASLDALHIHYSGKGPTWLTGLDNKPLAGAIGLLFLLSTAAGLGLVGQIG